MIKEIDYKENKRDTLRELEQYYHEKFGVESQPNEHNEKCEFIKEISLVYEDEGKVLGRLVGYIDWTTYSLRIEDLFVESNTRGKGTGKQLLIKAEEMAVQNGCHTSFVDTTRSNNVGFYQKQGYSFIGELQDYPAKGEIYYFCYKRLANI